MIHSQNLKLMKFFLDLNNIEGFILMFIGANELNIKM